MLTVPGARLVLSLLAGDGSDSLKGGVIRVGNPDEVASVPIESLTHGELPESGRPVLVARATFAERDAVFEWTFREVVSEQGVVIDHVEQDGGRKPFGAVWIVEATLELPSGEQR